MRSLVFMMGFIILFSGCAVVAGVADAVFSITTKVITATANGAGAAVNLATLDSDDNKSDDNISKK